MNAITASFCVSIHSWKGCKVISSFNLQKRHKENETFLNLKNNLFGHKILIKISYWNILVAVSIATILDIMHIYFLTHNTTVK